MSSRLATRGPILGLASSSAGLFITLLIQVLSVPILLASFGIDRYASWLVLSAIPAYVSLSDFGLGSAAATDMTRLASRGRRDEAARTFQGARRMLTATSLVTATVLSIGAWFVNMPILFSLSGISRGEATATFILLVVGAMAAIQSSVLEGGYRCSGAFPAGVLGLNAIRFAEFVGVVVMAGLTGAVVVSAAGGLTLRLVATMLYRYRLKRRSRWLFAKARSTGGQIARLRPLIVPSLAGLALPLGNALNNQGILLVLSINNVSHQQLTVFGTVRTLCSLVRQVNNVVNHGLQGELTVLVATGEVARARRLILRGLSGAAAINGVATAAVLFFGPLIVSVWSHGDVRAGRLFMLLMILTALADTPYLAFIMLPIVENRHARITGVYLLAAAASVVVCALFVGSLGLNAAPISLFAVDVIVTPFAAVAFFSQTTEFSSQHPPT